MNPKAVDDVVLSLQTYLNPQVWNAAGAFSRISAWLSEGRLVVIRQAIAESFAERLHRCLADYPGWMLDESHEAGDPEPFHYRHHHIYDHRAFPPDLAWCRNVFSSDATKRFIERLSGRTCGGPTSISASWYQPGDFSTPHDDQLWKGNEARRVAFVWHLAKAWRPEWGGALYWCRTNRYVSPAFNTLVLFRVSDDSYHMVTPVSRNAESKRLAINGWWYGALDQRDREARTDTPLIAVSGIDVI